MPEEILFQFPSPFREPRIVSLLNAAGDRASLEYGVGEVLTLTSTPLNTPPVITPIEDSFARPNQIVVHTLEVFDADEDPISFSWRELSATGVAYQVNNNQLSFIAPNAEVDVVFECEVSDGVNVVTTIVKTTVELNQSSDDFEWTDITPSPDTKVFYVSPSGDDANDGSKENPFKTFAQAYNAVEPGRGDQIRLRSNGTYNIDNDLNKNNVVIAAYGDGTRPKLIGSFRLTGPSAASNLTIKGLDFRAAQKYDGNALRAVTDNFDNVIIEDCVFIHYKEPIVVQGDTPAFTIENVKFRRCIFFENGDKSPIDGSLTNEDRKNKRSSGLYISRAKTFLMEECIIAYCGFTAYDPDVRSQYNPDLGYRANASIYSHGVYNQYSTFNNSVFKNCIFIEPASHGLQVRAGGDIEGNVFYRCPIGFLLGNEWSNTAEKDQPIIGKIINNCIFDGIDLNYNDKRGWIGDLQQCEAVEFSGNICVNNLLASNPRGLVFGSSKINNSNYVIKDNIVNWTNPFYLVGKVNNLVFENNQYYNSWQGTKEIGINGIQIPRSAGKWQNTDVQPVITNITQSNNTSVNTRLPTINEVIPDFEAKILNQIENGWNPEYSAKNIYEKYKSFITSSIV